MKVFFFLGQTFFDQSILMAKYIKELHPQAEFLGIVCARSNLLSRIDKITDPRFKRYDWLNALEKQWLATPLDKDKLKKYENIFGTETLRSIIIADRELGYGYVSCGNVEKTELIKATISNDDARWRYVLGLVDYLFNLFQEERPDITFAYCVAGAVAMAIAKVSEHFGILFTQPIFTRIKHYHIIDDNATSNFTAVTKIYKEAIKSPDLVAKFLPEAEKFLQDFRNKPEKPQDSLTWIGLILKNTSIRGILKTLTIDIARWGAIILGLKGTRGVLRQRKGLEILRFNLRNTFALRKLARKRHQAFSYDLPTGEYIYYPLHVDPEASTMVLSPYHTDQLAIIEAISKNMPAATRLIVKEHLPCAGKRPSGFYHRISNIPGVTLVSPFLDNFTIIKNAKLITTITGTAGLEAIMLGKPVLIFAPVHYQIVGKGLIYHPEICIGLTKSIKDAMELDPAPEENIKIYLASVMQESVELSPDDLWFDHINAIDVSKREAAIHKIVTKILHMHQEKKSLLKLHPKSKSRRLSTVIQA